MASQTISNLTNSTHPILGVNMNNATKLTSSNYITWNLQITLFLQGHDLHSYISDTVSPPSKTITDNGVTIANPAFTQWERQDKLIFMALLGTITTPLQPLVSRATTTLEAWTILASTYGRPSRGHIKQIKEQIKKSTKGQRTIAEYMQLMKNKIDQLALLGKPLDHEDIVEYILDGLDDDNRVVVEQINGRDVPPTLEELHDKLVNREA